MNSGSKGRSKRGLKPSERGAEESKLRAGRSKRGLKPPSELLERGVNGRSPSLLKKLPPVRSDDDLSKGALLGASPSRGVNSLRGRSDGKADDEERSKRGLRSNPPSSDERGVNGRSFLNEGRSDDAERSKRGLNPPSSDERGVNGRSERGLNPPSSDERGVNERSKRGLRSNPPSEAPSLSEKSLLNEGRSLRGRSLNLSREPPNSLLPLPPRLPPSRESRRPPPPKPLPPLLPPRDGL